MAKKIFVNLPVKNLDKTKEFFSKLGFKFNPQFTDENAACMIIGENIYSIMRQVASQSNFVFTVRGK